MTWDENLQIITRADIPLPAMFSRAQGGHADTRCGLWGVYKDEITDKICADRNQVAEADSPEVIAIFFEKYSTKPQMSDNPCYWHKFDPQELCAASVAAFEQARGGEDSDLERAIAACAMTEEFREALTKFLREPIKIALPAGTSALVDGVLEEGSHRRCALHFVPAETKLVAAVRRQGS